MIEQATSIYRQARTAPGLLVDGSTLWVANGRDRTLTHLDAATGNNLSGSIPVGAGAIGMALAAGSLWVANQADLSVTRIDPTSGATQATIPVRDGPTSVALHGRVWVSDQYDATVAEIDPATNHVTHHATGSSVHSVAAVGNSLWVTSGAASIDPTHVGGTLTFSADSPGTSGVGIDPVTVYVPDVGAMERVVYDGLLTLRVADGLNSLGLVPDLALRVPIPTNGGRRYTFALRPGIHYSNGTIVKASDIQRGFRRQLTVAGSGNPALYTAVQGAENCITSPQHCDLSAGVHVDDTAGLIPFDLAEPDPAFPVQACPFTRRRDRPWRAGQSVGRPPA
jgi:ABC-type transport system substrate-binding protein